MATKENLKKKLLFLWPLAPDLSPAPPICANPYQPTMSFARSPLCDPPGVHEFRGLDSPPGPQPNPDQNLEPPVQQVSEQAKPPYMFRLPDELILRVLNQLSGNDRIVSLLSLRRVSQRLRRIVHEASIWRGIERNRGRQPFTEFPGEWRLLIEGDISRIQWVGLKQRLRRDRSALPKCAACRATPPRDLGEPESCRFVGPNVAADKKTWSNDSAYHCDGCHAHHPRAAFSQSQWDEPHKDGEGGKICIGRQGQVRLCEHVRIGWEDIEKHIEL
ncbi:hypothetical protein V8F33_012066 [Rhypophila sp. PSN 637]